MKRRCCVVMLGLVAAFAQAQTRTPTPSPKKETLPEWICRILQMDPKTYARLVGVRQGQEQMGGARIATADLQAHSESVVYECGECWSPAVIDGENIAFLKADGVWVKPLDGGSARLAVSARGLRTLVGKASGNAAEWVVLQHEANDEACEYRLRLADLSSGRLDSVSEQTRCLGEAELGGAPRWGALRGHRVLVNSPSGAGVKRILVGELASDGALASGARTSLLPWIDAQEDGIDRFDAVWLDDTRVVYVQK
jgi:hypothetical protein